MAAELEQMFQDFILNKIREIEGQSEDRGTTGAGEADDGGGEEGGGGLDTATGESSKKPKKHKKHKSKKKKKREKESSSESEREGKSRTSAEAGKEPGEENKSRHHRQHSGAKKKKKKKRRRKGDENSSDSESKQKEDSHSVSVRRQEDLPDIIPKQDSSGMGRGDSPSHSCSQSHSCSATKDSSPRHHCRSPTPSSSSEKKVTLEEPVQSQTRSPSDHLQPPQPAETQTAEPQKSEQSRTSPEWKDMKGNPVPGASRSSSDHPAEPRASEKPSTTQAKSPAKKKSRRRSRSRSPRRSKDKKSSKRPRRSRSPHRSHRRGSRSRSPSHRKRSRSRSGGRKSWRRSRSPSQSRRRVTYSQRDRWKREPSHSPVLILRKNRSSPTARKHCPPSNSSPQRVSDLDKEQLLEIAKANAAAMCAKAGMPIPASLRTSVLPLALPSMAMNAAMASMTAATVTAALSNIGTLSSLLPLPSITNKPPPAGAQPTVATLEEVKRKVTKQANSISIKEFTDKCRMIVDSTGELPVALPHVSDEEDDGKPFGGATLREQKVISFSINNTMVRPAGRTEVDMAKEFPVSSGSQHRKKEGEGQAAYGEWVPVDKTTDKAPAPSRKAQTNQPVPSGPSSSSETAAAAALPEVAEKPDNDVFPEPPQQPVDITQAVTERIKAQRRLAENPYDINAICMLSRAQEQVDAWAQSSTVPGLFTGSTGAQVLTSEELSNTGPQAWLKKDQFLRAAPVSGGVGEFLMRKMGWRTGEGLGRNREGTVEPIVIDFKVDRKGLVAEGEKPQKQTGGLVVTKDLMGKHPVSALIELCNKKRIVQPDFVMVHHSGPDHRKNFLFKVTVNGVDYQPQTASPNKKHAKAMAATVALQALGEVPADGPGLYTGPVFTAASTGPLFST